MKDLYPLKFTPIYKEKLWGGQKIKSVLKKDFGPMTNCGESWELSAVKGDVSIVSNGSFAGTDIQSLIEEYREALLGTSVYNRFNNEFPLLIKFIDASQDLSIQVHPDDALAQKKHNGMGKTEMWYVLQTDEGSRLISGFRRPTSKEEYLEYFESGKLMELLNEEQVTAGDAFFIPAGLVHAIGEGIMVAEIQQTSDITYRIYDFDRVGKDGKKRELHVSDALEAIDFSVHEHNKSAQTEEKNVVSPVFDTPWFTTNRLSLDQGMPVDDTVLDSFKIYICTGGSGTICGESISFGEVLLMPASLNNYTIEPNPALELLETYISN